MRKVTVERKRKIVASVMKIHIYVQSNDPVDLVLDNSNLRYVEAIKNGKSISFELPEEPICVYVVFDKNFPSKFNNKICLPAGNEEIVLVTAPSYNPLKGNPFEIWRK